MSWIVDASVISVTTLSQLISGAAATDVDKSDKAVVKKKPPMPLVVLILGQKMIKNEEG